MRLYLFVCVCVCVTLVCDAVHWYRAVVWCPVVPGVVCGSAPRHLPRRPTLPCCMFLKMSATCPPPFSGAGAGGGCRNAIGSHTCAAAQRRRWPRCWCCCCVDAGVVAAMPVAPCTVRRGTIPPASPGSARPSPTRRNHDGTISLLRCDGAHVPWLKRRLQQVLPVPPSIDLP